MAQDHEISRRLFFFFFRIYINLACRLLPMISLPQSCSRSQNAELMDLKVQRREHGDTWNKVEAVGVGGVAGCTFSQSSPSFSQPHNRKRSQVKYLARLQKLRVQQEVRRLMDVCSTFLFFLFFSLVFQTHCRRISGETTSLDFLSRH